MRFSFKIALRFLKSGKAQTFLIALGIAIGVSVQIFIGLLIQGLQQNLIEKTIGNSPHLTVLSQSDDKQIRDWEESLKIVRDFDPRVKSTSVSADGSAFAKFEESSEPVLLRGFNLDEANKIYQISEKVYQGEKNVSENQVLVGKELKEKLLVNLGDTLKLITPDGNIVELTVKGFFDFKVTAINKSWLITDLKTAQNAFGYENRITSMEVQIEDIFKAKEMGAALSNKLDADTLKVENWMTQNEQLLSGLKGQSISSIMIQIFVLVSVVLGIASVLAITVLQKSKQIGILKAMGLKDRVASQVFLFQGLLLGIAGAILGILIGVGLILMFTKFAVNSDGTPVVPVNLDTGFIAISGLIAVLSASVASLIPARKSSKLSPIEVIRNG